MTNEELLAAANNWLNPEQSELSTHNWHCEADKLARYVRRMLDPTPCDEEWWLAAAEMQTAWGNGVYAQAFKSSVEFWVTDTTIANAKTRGQVRQLCAALGIELREEA